jgi:hypothetical protein
MSYCAATILLLLASPVALAAPPEVVTIQRDAWGVPCDLHARAARARAGVR